MSKWLWIAACVVLAFISLVASAVGEDSSTQDDSGLMPFADIPLFERVPTNPPAAQPDKAAVGVLPKQPGAISNKASLVNDLGDPQRISFLGTQSFTPEQLQRALQSDLKYQAAGRPSADLARLLVVLQERLLDGYRFCGCPDAKVTVWRDETTNSIQVQVLEGSRYRQGKVVISGPPAINQAAIQQSLTNNPQPRPWRMECDGVDLTKASDDDEPAWKEGDDVHYDTRSVEAIDATLRRALAEQGFPRANFETSIIPLAGSDTTELNVEIKVLSTPARIDGIEITGLKRNTREELLQFVGVSMGDTLDAALLDRVHTRVKKCCRFWNYRVAAVIADAQSKTDAGIQTAGNLLSINLEEYSEVPPLGKPLSEADEVLRRTGLLLSNLEAAPGRADLVIEARGYQQFASGIKAVRSIIAVDGRVLVEALSVPDSPVDIDHALFLSSAAFEIFDWKAREEFVTPFFKSSLLSLKVRQGGRQDDEFPLSIMLGAAVPGRKSTRADHASPWQIELEPVALLQFGHKTKERKSRVSVRRGVFKYDDGYLTLRLDAETGRLVDLRYTDPELGRNNQVTAYLEEGAYDRVAAVLRKNAQEFQIDRNRDDSVVPFLQYALASAAKQPIVKESPQYAGYCRLAANFLANPRIQRFLKDKDDSVGADAQNQTASDDKLRRFKIPNHAKNHSGGMAAFIDGLICAAPAFAEESSRRGSWPWTLAREICFRRFADGAADASPEENAAMRAKEFARLRGQKLGPFSALAFARIYKLLPFEDFPEVAAVVQQGLSDTSPAAFENDARGLTETEDGLPDMCVAIIEEFGKLPVEERHAMTEPFPPEWKELLRRIGNRRTAFPSEEVADTIRMVLTDQQDSGLRSTVVHELHDAAERIARAKKNDTTTK